MAGITIDRVGSGAARLLDHVAPDVFNASIDPALLGSYLAQPGTMLLVARDGELVVGQVKAAIHWHPDKPADLYIDEVGVAGSHQRRGIARLLIAEIERWARERGCVDIWLAADVENDAARQLYGNFADSKPCLLYFWDL